MPELAEHINFNVRWLSRTLQPDDESTVIAASTLHPPTGKSLPSDEVLIIVLTQTFARGGEAARLLAKRANHRVGALALLEGTASTADALVYILRTSTARYALIVSEDTFPARDWLRHAHYSLTGHGAEAVLANTAVPAKTAQWMNTMAKPSLLSEVLQNGNFGEAKKVEAPNFLLALTSEVDHGRASSDPVPSNIHVIEVGRGENHEGGPHLAEEVCVIMPSIDVNRADYTAQLLHERAGMRADIVIAHDVERQGFIPTLNHVARRSSASWVVYLAEDALPGDAWLRKAHARLSSTDSSLLAFNCGKWHGRVAAFGMVKKSWAYGLYGDQVLYEGYQSHRADNELTAIAKAQDEFIYAPECVLVEHDPHKDTRSSERAASNFRREDARLFRQRFQENFVGLVRPEQLEPFYEEYLDLKAHYAKKGPVLGVP
ncbi:hypothetical protein [Nesterenkonia sp. NBAIMH1]|uniref:hypothetical protein n=1 Tax=Nesterenkonia sp. NBAIMH1 TaxID=2600320 RepID=UPI0011B42F06|nr:hypothetical protein [Nesterenkonia sp. NBAIMH1]